MVQGWLGEFDKYFLNWIANYQIDEVEIKQERNATWGYRRSRVVSVDAPWMIFCIATVSWSLLKFQFDNYGMNFICFGLFWYVLVICLFLNFSHVHHVAPCPPSLVVTRYMWMTPMVAKHTWCGRVSYDPSTTWEKPGHCSGWCEQVMWHRRIYIEWSFNNLQESLYLIDEWSKFLIGQTLGDVALNFKVAFLFKCIYYVFKTVPNIESTNLTEIVCCATFFAKAHWLCENRFVQKFVGDMWDVMRCQYRLYQARFYHQVKFDAYPAPVDYCNSSNLRP